MTDEEQFDVVNAADEVLFQAPRSEVHRQKWLHRAVHVFVFRPTGELLVHQRSSSKDEEPLKWNSSCSGHVSAGEHYWLAATRELQEELGLTGELELVGKLPACEELAFEHTWLFELTTTDEPVLDAGEIAEARWLPLQDVYHWRDEHPQEFSRPFLTLLDWYRDKTC